MSDRSAPQSPEASPQPPFQEPVEHTDATLNELPLLPSERIWGFWDFSSVNISYAVATWAFLQGAAVAYYVGVVQAIATLTIGYGISILLVSIAPCLPSAKYGVEQYIGLRSVFGAVGARVVMIVISTILAAAWSAILAIMFGHGLATVLESLFDLRISQSSGAITLLAVAGVSISWAILSRGPVSLERTSRLVAPAMGVIIVSILGVIFVNHSWSDLTGLPPLAPADDPHTSFMLAVELSVAGGFAWWPNIGNLARLTRTPRAAFWPNWLGLFLASIGAAVVGVLAALVLQVEDPTQWMIPLVGTVLGIIGLTIVGFANITAIVSTGYSSMVALKGGGGSIFRSMAWPVMLLVVLGPAFVLTLFPDTVYNNYGRFLSWGAILLAPLCGVQLVDYFFLRRTSLNVRALYAETEGSPYRYWRGVNPAAFASVAVGAVCYTLLLNPVTYAPSGAFPYITASVPSFAIAGITHFILTRLIVQRANRGGYRQPIQDRPGH